MTARQVLSQRNKPSSLSPHGFPPIRHKPLLVTGRTLCRHCALLAVGADIVVEKVLDLFAQLVAVLGARCAGKKKSVLPLVKRQTPPWESGFGGGL